VASPDGYFPAARWVARVAALATAFNEAVTISLSMPTPYNVLASVPRIWT